MCIESVEKKEPWHKKLKVLKIISGFMCFKTKFISKYVMKIDWVGEWWVLHFCGSKLDLKRLFQKWNMYN